MHYYKKSRHLTGANGSTSTLPGPSLPFPLLFAEPVPAEYLAPVPVSDITAQLARLLGRAAPTGKKDKILILSSRDDPHTDEVALALSRRGAPVVRFNTDALLQDCGVTIHVGNGEEGRTVLALPTHDLALDEVKSVWFRRPELPAVDKDDYDDDVTRFLGRESEAVLNNILDMLRDAFWVSHPLALKASDNKLTQLRLAASVGLTVPRTLVTNDPDQAREFYDACAGEMIVKAFRGWSGATREGYQSVWTSRVLPQHLDEPIEQVRHIPCLFQEYVPKDVELRVTVIGRRVFAAEIHSQQSERSRDDWRRYDFDNTPYYPHTLPAEVEAALLRILDRFNLAFGAFDLIRRPDGEYVFLELNANGQWFWVQQLTGMPMVDEMADLLLRGSL